MPAEWEKQSAVLLSWPHAGTDWAYILEEIEKVFVEMAKAIAHHENLIITGEAAEHAAELLKPLMPPEDYNRITAFKCPNNDTWIRDYGPLTVFIENNGQDCQPNDDRRASLNYPLSIIHYPLAISNRFNGWGGKFEASKDNNVCHELFTKTNLFPHYEEHPDFELEGGSLECDGKGTIFTTASCLLNANRNGGLSQEEAESRLKQLFNVERVLWLFHSYLVGDDTDGHIDMLMRICPDDTIVYQGCDDTEDEQYEELLAMQHEIEAFRTLEGKEYRLLRLPLPKAIFDEDGERLPASYANYLVINGAVLLPVYQQPSDDEAIKILAQAYPNHKIIPIFSVPLIKQHGAVHCSTMQLY